VKHAVLDQIITATVTKFIFNGIGESPASNEGYITIMPVQTTQPRYVLYLGGPDDQGDMSLEIVEYMRRVNAIYKSYNSATPITIKLRHGASLPVIMDIT
jgi:hypothetical protein